LFRADPTTVLGSKLIICTAASLRVAAKIAARFVEGIDRITLPPARTKNSRQHELPLSHQALAILVRQPRGGEFVFGERGFGNWGAPKTALDQRTEIADWHLHDLRRTCATGMAELGVQPHIIEAVLNNISGHKSGVSSIYNRARYTDEMRIALQRWADHLDKITA